MKALSVRAPWTWWIMYGEKDIENRGPHFPRNVYGRVLIHQSKWWRDEEVADDHEDAAIMYERGHQCGLNPMSGIGNIQEWCGCIIGSVEIVDYVTRSRSYWFQGDVGLVLRNPIMLPKLIPYKGMLGFFNVPDSIVRL